MIILKRFENQAGNAVAYYFKDGDIEDITNAENLFLCANMVSNAIFIGNDFIAKQGSEIETINIGNDTTIYFNGIEHPLVINIFSKYYGGDFIDICLKIRSVVKSGNFIISNDLIDKGKSLLLCGIDVVDFVKNFLEVLQPFCIQCIDEKLIVFTERFFKFILTFSVDEDLIISIQYNDCNDLHTYLDKQCVIIPDEFMKGNRFVVVTLQRLFIQHKIKVYASLCKDNIAVVSFYDILKETKKAISNVDPVSRTDGKFSCIELQSSVQGGFSFAPVYSFMERLSMLIEDYPLIDISDNYKYLELVYNEFLLPFDDSVLRMQDKLILKYGLNYNAVFNFIYFLLDLLKE